MSRQQDWRAGFQLDWQTLIMTVGVIMVMVGGFWTLAYLPISSDIDELKKQIESFRNIQGAHSVIQESIARINQDILTLKKETEARRQELATRQDVQNGLNTTRLEFLSEIKRLDQVTSDALMRREFDRWRNERERTINSIEDRLKTLHDSLDVLNAKILVLPERK